MNRYCSWMKLSFVFLISLLLVCPLSGCATDTPSVESLLNDELISAKIKQQHLRKSRKITFSATHSAVDSQPVKLNPSTRSVRAIYVTSHVANGKRMTALIDLVKQTELNAMVIDINSGINLVRADGKGRLSARGSAKHFRQVIKKLKEQKIYLIARIVTFKNPELAKAMPAWTIRRKNGKVWTDRNGVPWIDPYRQEAWEYLLALAEKAAKLGFDEIQYDYVRFPDNGIKVDREVAYSNDEGWKKSEAIRRFLHRANLRVHKSGAKVSADVFGMVGSSDDDMGIGQNWDAIAREVDVISPMIYPSHYSKGIWGIANPDLSPGPIIARALKDTTKHNRKLNERGIATAKVRPWLQGFTAGWIHPHQTYKEAQIREQIRAARNAGFNSYMIWNSSSRYPKFTT